MKTRLLSIFDQYVFSGRDIYFDLMKCNKNEICIPQKLHCITDDLELFYSTLTNILCVSGIIIVFIQRMLVPIWQRYW